MKIKIQLVIEAQEGMDDLPLIEEIGSFERGEATLETLGLSLVEAKELLAATQKKLVTAQLQGYLQTRNQCEACGKTYGRKGHQKLVFRTLFGKLGLDSPRFYQCKCNGGREENGAKSFSPLTTLLSERAAPEFIYLQTKWAALMSYGLTAQLLHEVLPLEKPLSTGSLTSRVRKCAERLEKELGDEQASFIEGCPSQWAAFPQPAAPLTVGIDGGYVRGREGKNRKAGPFEIIVGKSMPSGGPNKRFGFVSSYDTKPKRRLFELLKSQGMQANQQVTFLSDGGDTVRDLQLYLNPQGEHLLDWFHITMRLTVLKQYAKGLPLAKALPKPTNLGEENAEEEFEWPTPEETLEKLDKVKWKLWHGNVYKALQLLDYLEDDLDPLGENRTRPEITKLYKGVQEFKGYIRANESYLVNYGDRYRNKETISSAFVESTVNEIISKRFVKKQQMRWTKPGAHLLLQVRIKVLNEDWHSTFCNWYPGLKPTPDLPQQKQAA